MSLDILTNGIDQAIALTQNASTPDARKEAIALIKPELERLTYALQAIEVMDELLPPGTVIVPS
jgi:hypothetical protein